MSPAGQKKWLVELSNAIASVGAIGVIYWEPAWLSSDCPTKWGQGSLCDNISFFDSGQNKLIADGGVNFLQQNYTIKEPPKEDRKSANYIKLTNPGFEQPGGTETAAGNIYRIPG